MATNYGPTAFQANAFQAFPIAFQIDNDGEEAAGGPANWGGQSLATKVWTAEAPPAQSWVPEEELSP